MTSGTLPEEIEIYRDRSWCRDPELRIEEASAAEKVIDRLGFCSALTDARRSGPSLYLAVCGRRDAHIPRRIQKDPESSLAWTIKDEAVRRGHVYYGKLKGGRSFFIARRLIPHFNTLWGFTRPEEPRRLSKPAHKLLKILRKEWEISTRDLRTATDLSDRITFNKALDELQRAFKVIPTEVVYEPVFTYIWSLTESRFADELTQEVERDEALKQVAHAYLIGAGMTLRGELARVTGLSKPDAGLGNWALVDEGLAVRLAPGVYRLKGLKVTESAPSTKHR
jgi:hypothetical protein